jgi:hypothetical protein
LLLNDIDTIFDDYGISRMQRLKNTEPGRPPRPASSLLAGLLIGSTIMTMATQAMLMGATAAINHIPLKEG